jgi:hypothetical protein
MLRRVAGVVAVAAAVGISAAPASAVTIGQIGTPSGSVCGFQEDWAQPSVSSGTPYVVPSTGGVTMWTVTSWDTRASGPAQATMKFFRKTSDPAGYTVVAHSGPQPLVSGGPEANTFPADIGVRSGDVLGLFTVTTDSCLATSTDSFLFTGAGGPSGLQDGQSADFTTGTNGRLQIEATLEPFNEFEIVSQSRNKKRGTALFELNLPNPGTVTAGGRFARTVVRPDNAVGAGPASVRVLAAGKKRQKLNDRGVVKLPFTITYTPAGGSPKNVLVPLALKKKIRR